VTRRRGRRRRKLLDDLKERRGYSHLKEEALHRTMWRARFGPVVRQTAKWMNKSYIFTSIYMYIYIYILFLNTTGVPHPKKQNFKVVGIISFSAVGTHHGRFPGKTFCLAACRNDSPHCRPWALGGQQLAVRQFWSSSSLPSPGPLPVTRKISEHYANLIKRACLSLCQLEFRSRVSFESSHLLVISVSWM
jgi:hypothetical protein